MKNLIQDWYSLLGRRAASKRGARRFWFAAAVFILLLNLYAPAGPTLVARLLATTIILLAGATIWRWIYRGGGEADFGFLPVFAIIFGLEYALPVFTLKFYSMDVFADGSLPDSTVEKALLMALLGLISILVGYYYPGRRRVAQSLPQFRMPWRDTSVVKFVAIAFAALGLFAFAITVQMQLSPEIQAYVNRPSDFFYLAIIALLMLQLQGQLTRGYAAFLWVVLIPLHVLVGLAQGALGSSMVEASALLIAYTTLRRNIPWAMFVAGFAAFFFIQPVKASLRSMVFAGRRANLEQGQGEKFQALAFAGEQGLAAVQNLDPKDLLSIASNRLASIMVLATIVDQTPQNVPYWHGASYYPFLFIPVPRLIYPEKPKDLPGNILGHQYGKLPEDDELTSINLMQLLELYGNFGPLGVVLGSILIGMMYRTINDALLHPGSGFGALVGGVYIFTHLTDIENAAVNVFGSLFLQFVTVMIFYYAVRFAESAASTLEFRRRTRSHALAATMEERA